MAGVLAAVDLGAATGRVFVGAVTGQRLDLRPVARFPNVPLQMVGGLHWNATELWAGILTGLSTAAAGSADGLASVGVDSWGADYALLVGGRLLGVPFHYRDARGERGVESVHASIDRRSLYERNGLESLPFNSLYQLAVDSAEGMTAIAETLAFMPDLYGYWLTGRVATEPTIASTSGLLDVRSRSWDTDLADLLGIRSRLLPELLEPGRELGVLLPPIAAVRGMSRTIVRKVASHDTASAVVGTPIESEAAAYLSCGTWALLGVEVDRPVLTERTEAAGFTNEAGVDGRILLQKNLMGLALVNGVIAESQGESLQRALRAAVDVRLDTSALIDPSDPAFLRPGSVISAIRNALSSRGIHPPETAPELVRCVVDSLAAAFACAIDDLEGITGRRIRTLHIVGGGSQNELLCQLTADRVERTVLAGPVEASVVGNLLVQARAAGDITGDLTALRAIVRNSFVVRRFEPRTRH